MAHYKNYERFVFRRVFIVCVLLNVAVSIRVIYYNEITAPMYSPQTITENNVDIKTCNTGCIRSANR